MFGVQKLSEMRKLWFFNINTNRYDWYSRAVLAVLRIKHSWMQSVSWLLSGKQQEPFINTLCIDLVPFLSLKIHNTAAKWTYEDLHVLKPP